MKKSERATEVFRRLKRLYPNAKCALRYRTPWQLLVATILSAQCTDKRVNMVTPALFKKFSTPASTAKADLATLEDLVHSTGFYRNKAKAILGCARMITEMFKGRVPDTLPELLTLPGVARKTANVVLGSAFGKQEGIVVDTHVSRISRRLGLTKQTDPRKIEQDLMKLYPTPQWTALSMLLIDHGRARCMARSPVCDRCPLNDICPSAFKV